MTFNICEDCGEDPLAGVLILALVWCVPTLLYVIRHQLIFKPVAAKMLGFLQPVLVAAAILFSVVWFDLVDTSDPLLRFTVSFALVAGAACTAAVAFRRKSQQRRERRS